MIGALALVSLIAGGALAYAGERLPAQVQLLENTGGALLLAGLALIGSALPIMP